MLKSNVITAFSLMLVVGQCSHALAFGENRQQIAMDPGSMANVVANWPTSDLTLESPVKSKSDPVSSDVKPQSKEPGSKMKPDAQFSASDFDLKPPAASKGASSALSVLQGKRKEEKTSVDKMREHSNGLEVAKPLSAKDSSSTLPIAPVSSEIMNEFKCDSHSKQIAAAPPHKSTKREVDPQFLSETPVNSSKVELRDGNDILDSKRNHAAEAPLRPVMSADLVSEKSTNEQDKNGDKASKVSSKKPEKLAKRSKPAKVASLNKPAKVAKVVDDDDVPVKVSQKPSSSTSSDSSPAARSASFVVGTIFGMPVAMFRTMGTELQRGTSEFTGNSSNPVLKGVVGAALLPFAAVCGLWTAPVIAVENAYRSAPFSRETFCLGEDYYQD